MIILDTNVISELMRLRPTAEVRVWMDGQRTNDLFTTSITEAELRFGVASLPEGARRRSLEAEVDAMIAEGFRSRVLPFDGQAAKSYARILAHRRRQGRPIRMADAMIAGIAAAHGATLATRNTRDFVDCGLTLADPWTA